MAAIGVANNAPVKPNAAPIANNITNDDTGWIFIVEERSFGIKKSDTISFNNKKNNKHHNAVNGLIESATKVGGIAIM